MSSADTVRLGDVAAFIRGITFKPEDVVPLGTPGAVACMRTKNVQAEVDLSDVWAVADSLVKRDDQYLREQDILVSSANSWNLVGKCSWIPEIPWRATFGGFVSVLRANPDKVDPRYLFHWFASKRIQTTVRSFGQQTTNISNLNIDRCLNLPLPLPSTSEQRRIAAILDKADDLRAKRRAALAQLETLTQAIFLDMFGDPATNPRGWPRRTLGELIVVGPQNGLYKPAEDYGSGTRILRIDAFYDGVVTKLDSLKRVRVSAQELSLYALREGEIVINRVNSREYLGKSALVPKLAEPTVFESNMMRFDVDRDRLNPHYLIHSLQTAFVRAHINRCAKDAINQSSINQKDVKAMPLVLPPVSLQREFAGRVAAVATSRRGQVSAADELDALFASLQDLAFRGEL